MSTAAPDVEQIVNNYFKAWNASTDQRHTIVDSTFTNDAYYCDGAAEASGRDDITAMMAGVMTQFEGASFEQSSPVDSHHHQARFSWRMLAADGSTMVDGIDAIRFTETGQISSALGFFGVEIPSQSGELTAHTFSWNRQYAVDADRLFELVSDLEVYATVAPNLSRIDVLSGEGEGLVRRCTNPEGESWNEVYTEWSPPDRFVVTPDVTTYPPSLAAMIANIQMSVQVTEIAEQQSSVGIEVATQLTELGVQVLRDGGAADALFVPILDGWAAHL